MRGSHWALKCDVFYDELLRALACASSLHTFISVSSPPLPPSPLLLPSSVCYVWEVRAGKERFRLEGHLNWIR